MGNAVGTIMMYLWRAFDKMSHGLVITKLNAYGVTEIGFDLIISYRTQNNAVISATMV